MIIEQYYCRERAKGIHRKNLIEKGSLYTIFSKEAHTHTHRENKNSAREWASAVVIE